MRRSSQVFHDRSCSTCWVIGSRLRTALPNWWPRSRRAGAITQPMPSAAPSSSAWPPPCGPGPTTSCSATTSASIGAKNRGDPVRPRAPVEAAAAMDVVGGDAQRRARPVSHYAMIARGDARAGSRVVRCSGCCWRSHAGRRRAARKPPGDPLLLERNMLTVSNQSDDRLDQRRSLAEHLLPRHDVVDARGRAAFRRRSTPSSPASASGSTSAACRSRISG